MNGHARRFLHAAIALLGLIGQPRSAEARDKLPLAVFSFPSIANMMADVIIAKGFGEANGFEVEPTPFGTAGAFWAAVAKGDIPTHYQSAFQMRKMAADGVPLVVYATLVQIGSLQVVTKNPAVRTFQDLRGRSIAGTVGFAEYDYVSLYAGKIGLPFNKDVAVVNATTATGRAQLEAGRVDALVSWEPTTTLIMNDNPDARIILDGNTAWRGVAGTNGWQQLLFARTDDIASRPDAIRRFVRMYQQAARFMMSRPDEADAIVASGKYTSRGVPPGTVGRALREGRLILDVRPSWEPAVNAEIWKMLEVGKEAGLIPALPPRETVLSADPGP